MFFLCMSATEKYKPTYVQIILALSVGHIVKHSYVCLPCWRRVNHRSLHYRRGDGACSSPPGGELDGWGGGVGRGSARSNWRAPWVSIRWSRLSSRVLFVLLFFPEAHYSARSYFTTEIFILQVTCACGVIPYYATSGNWRIPVNRTAYQSSCLLFPHVAGMVSGALHVT